jgi:hypothetical protein
VVNLVYAFFDTFAIIHATTNGGPADATSILVYRVYATGFVGQDYGSSAAQSVVLMVLVIGMTFVQFRFIERQGAILMVENRPWLTILTHAVLIGAWLPVLSGLDGACGLDPSRRGAEPVSPSRCGSATRAGELHQLLTEGSPAAGGVPLRTMMLNSLSWRSASPSARSRSRCSRPMPSSISASLRMVFFWLIFITLMLPVEVRILPTYDVVASARACSTATGPDRSR